MINKNKKERLLILLGIVCMLVIVVISFSLIRFLVKNLNEALNFQPKSPNVSVFDTQGFETLDLISEKQSIQLLESTTTVISSSTEKTTSTKLIPPKKI